MEDIIINNLKELKNKIINNELIRINIIGQQRCGMSSIVLIKPQIK